MGRNNPKIGDKVKAGGATWEYKRVNANGYGRSFLWVTQARIGIDISGKPVKRRIYAATPDEGVIELLTKRREFTAELDEARAAELHPTVRQAFAKYLEYVKPHLRKNTYDGYEQLSRLHLQDIFDIRLDKVTREELQAAVNAELEKFSKKSVIKYVTIFNQVRSHFELPSIKGLRYSDKTGGIREDDFSFMAHAHDLPAPADVVKKAAEFDGGRLYRFVIFGLMSMRIGEICGLTYGDISEHNGRHYITLRRQRGDKHDTWELKSRQSYRTILLDEDFYNSLEFDLHEDNEFICPQNENTYRGHFREFKKYCGITREFTPHTLRHIYASHCVARGYNEVCVRMCGGWSIGKDVMSRFYIERNAKACDEFMFEYYRDLFGSKESKEPSAPVIALSKGGKSA